MNFAVENIIRQEIRKCIQSSIAIIDNENFQSGNKQYSSDDILIIIMALSRKIKKLSTRVNTLKDSDFIVYGFNRLLKVMSKLASNIIQKDLSIESIYNFFVTLRLLKYDENPLDYIIDYLISCFAITLKEGEEDE